MAWDSFGDHVGTAKEYSCHSMQVPSWYTPNLSFTRWTPYLRTTSGQEHGKNHIQIMDHPSLISFDHLNAGVFLLNINTHLCCPWSLSVLLIPSKVLCWLTASGYHYGLCPHCSTCALQPWLLRRGTMKLLKDGIIPLNNTYSISLVNGIYSFRT